MKNSITSIFVLCTCFLVGYSGSPQASDDEELEVKLFCDTPEAVAIVGPHFKDKKEFDKALAGVNVDKNKSDVCLYGPIFFTRRDGPPKSTFSVDGKTYGVYPITLKGLATLGREVDLPEPQLKYSFFPIGPAI